jgi:hypothetical protein
MIKIKEGCTATTTDFWYDLTDGGYLVPDKICESPKDAERVNKAVAIVLEFQKSCEWQIEGFNR